MRQLLARYNAGRWMVDCPIHGIDGAVLAEHRPDISPLWTEGGQYICPACYPGIKAQLPTMNNGVFSMRFDKSMRATAMRAAMERDEVYQVVFPENKAEIEQAVADRPLLMRNWDGEPVGFLQGENAVIQKVVKKRATRKKE